MVVFGDGPLEDKDVMRMEDSQRGQCWEGEPGERLPPLSLLQQKAQKWPSAVQEQGPLLRK